MLIRLLLSVLLIQCSRISTQAKSNPYNIDDPIDETLQSGFRELYNLNFESAKEILTPLTTFRNKHALVDFSLATVAWWENSVNVMENDEQASQIFLMAAEISEKGSLARIKQGDETGEAHMALGSLYALLARWDAANRKWLSVFTNEKKARYYLTKALSLNPKATDAYMALGIFDYTLATLPKVVRYLSTSSAGGNKQKGIQELTLAAERGVYLRLPAIFFLANIYTNQLNQPEKSIELLSNLRKEFPNSPFVDLMMFIALYNQDCPVEISVEAEDYEYRVESGVYRPEFRIQSRFFNGLVKFKRKEWLGAVREFNLATAAYAPQSPFYIWSLLYTGYALDALGKRQEALDCYRLVLKERARWQSHDLAEKRIKKPFSPADSEMKTLLL
ncbi:MAG: hypothetical protein KCHDKBKB_01791 [Elusimicrobia bacterium]|nr:hypothetical protein [Elusimicrobiota bacterium]